VLVISGMCGRVLMRLTDIENLLWVLWGGLHVGESFASRAKVEGCRCGGGWVRFAGFVFQVA